MGSWLTYSWRLLIVQGKSDGASMLLVNENGIILTVNAHHTPQAHVTSHNKSSGAPLHASLGETKGR